MDKSHPKLCKFLQLARISIHLSLGTIKHSDSNRNMFHSRIWCSNQEFFSMPYKKRSRAYKHYWH